MAVLLTWPDGWIQGILDEYYQELQPPQDEGFVPEVINMFLHEADMMLNDITSLLSVPYHCTKPSAFLSPIVLGIDFVSSA